MESETSSPPPTRPLPRSCEWVHDDEPTAGVSMKRTDEILKRLKLHPLIRRLWSPIHRTATACRYVVPPCCLAARWVLNSREWTNFTYDLTQANVQYLVALLAVVTRKSEAELTAFAEELVSDEGLQAHVREFTQRAKHRHEADLPARFGRRIGWYVLARAMKPQVTVETGIDKGLGAVVLCSALLRNTRDGQGGRYMGTDINPNAGYLLAGPYGEAGQVLVGDSLESLNAIDCEIDLFINDSDHSSGYEYAEYQAIASKLSDKAVIVGDNAHVTDSLLRFSRETGRAFLFWKEQPAGHWYAGGGIGISWKPS